MTVRLTDYLIQIFNGFLNSNFTKSDILIFEFILTVTFLL